MLKKDVTRLWIDLLCTVLLSTTRVETVSLSDIESIYNDVINGINKDIRPQLDQTVATNLTVDLSLMTLHDINAVDGSMTIMGFFMFMWKAENIAWNPGSYNGASLLTIPYDKIWRPQIANSNAAGSAEMFGTDNSYLTVYSTGQVMWGSGETLEFSCDIDTTYFPFDTQKCTMKIETCGYQVGEIMFDLGSMPIKTAMFSENSEWKLIHTSALFDNSGMASVSFNFHFKRRHLFLLITLILPAIFLTMLNILVFLLPQTGGRIGFAMTILLSIVVFLTIAQSLLPPTATPRLSAICIMLVIDMVMSGMIVASLVICDLVYYKPDDEQIPNWIKSAVQMNVPWSNKTRNNIINVTQPTAIIKVDETKEKKAIDDDDKQLTWQRVARLWDKLSLYLFILWFVVVRFMLIIDVLANS